MAIILTKINYFRETNPIFADLAFISLILAVFGLFLFFPIATSLSILIFIFLALITSFPEYLLYLLVFSIPFINLYIPVEYFNLHYFGFYKDFELPIVDLIAIALFVGFWLKRLISGKIFNFKEDKLKKPAIFAFLAFFAVSLLSAMNAHNWFASAWYSIRWIAVFYFIYVLLPVNIIKDKKILRNVIISFVFASIFVSLMGVASLLYQDFSNDFIRLKPIGISTVYPIGFNQKQISEILVVGSMLVLSLKYWFKDAWADKILLFIWAVFMLVLLGSFSRAAWLVAGLQIIFLLYQHRNLIKIHQIKITIASLALGILFLVPAYYMLSIQSNAPGIGSNKHRALLTTIAMDGLARHPILGQGSGDFFYLIENSIRYTATGASIMDSHGLWQKIAAEMGLLGVASFGAFVLAIAVFVYQKYKKIVDLKDKQLLLYAIIAVLSIFLFEWFDTSFYRGKLWLPVGIMIATAYVLENKNKHENITD